MSDSLLPAEADNSQDNPAEAPAKIDAPTAEAAPEVQKLILGKFKTEQDVQKSYTELEKRFGGFTGAPEAYEMPEEVDPEDTFVKTLTELGAKNQMSQDTFNELLDLGEQMYATKADFDQEKEMEALGQNAGQRLANIDGFLRNNLGEKYEELKGVVNNAQTVELVEALIGATASAKLPTGASVPSSAPTQGEIESMMKETDAQGKIIYHYSKARQREVQAAFGAMSGTN